MLGKQIEAYLKATERNQESLCDILNLSPAVVAKILNGKRKMSAVEYFLVCDALGVSLEHFKHSA